MRWSRLLAVLALFIIPCMAVAQSDSCQAPVLRPAPAGANLFSEKQEMDLAVLRRRALEQDALMIEEEDLTGELKRVGDRLSVAFPKTGIKFNYYILDLPEANAFSQGGGNIYFTRKLIAFLRSEDELAAVMAHEMGHIMTHQDAIEVSRQMKAVLGITQLTDSDDVEEKYNELLDNYRKKPKAFRHGDKEEHEQIDADQVAVFAVAASGYDVKSLPAFWDRFTENKGKKGNAFTDLFGGTTEEQRRFRDMLKNAAALPSGCVGKHPQTSVADFKKWQQSVVAYDGIGHRERLLGLIERKPLTPPLRAEVTQLKISPDNKYVLVADSGSVSILHRADLKQFFRIDVAEAKAVHFTPDSKAVALYSMGLFSSPRVEIWDIEDKALRGAYELHVPNGCNQAALSPDAKYFACVTPQSEIAANYSVMFDLRILSTETGEMTYEKKGLFAGEIFSTWTHLWTAILNGEELRVVAMHFSPDSKYLLVGRDSITAAFDCATGAKLNLPNSIKDIMHQDFDFLSGDRMVGGAGNKGDKGAVVKFPSGEVVYSNLRMGLAHVNAATSGDYVLVYPMKDYASAIFDIKKNQFVSSSKKSTAVDMYGDEYICERGDGSISLLDTATSKELKVAPLAEGPLGRIVAENASDDLNFVAISGTVRGAVWNVGKGTRVQHLRRFNGVAVDNAGFMVADFPVEGETKRQFAQIDPTGRSTSFVADEDSKHYEHGAYLLDWLPAKKGEWKKNVTLNVKSMRTGGLLWTRQFPNGAPSYFISDDIDSMVFAYDVNDANGKAAVQASDELKSKVQALKTRDHAYAIDAVNLKTGKTEGLMAIDTGKGSFQLHDAFRAGKNLIVADSTDRVQVYGFDGIRRGRLQSHGAMASKDGCLMAVSVGRGKLVIYDLEKFKQIDELDFSTRIAMFRFSSDSNRLLVVTRDQKAYYFDTKQFWLAEQVAAN